MEKVLEQILENLESLKNKYFVPSATEDFSALSKEKQVEVMKDTFMFDEMDEGIKEEILKRFDIHKAPFNNSYKGDFETKAVRYAIKGVSEIEGDIAKVEQALIYAKNSLPRYPNLEDDKQAFKIIQKEIDEGKDLKYVLDKNRFPKISHNSQEIIQRNYEATFYKKPRKIEKAIDNAIEGKFWEEPKIYNTASVDEAVDLLIKEYENSNPYVNYTFLLNKDRFPNLADNERFDQIISAITSEVGVNDLSDKQVRKLLKKYKGYDEEELMIESGKAMIEEMAEELEVDFKPKKIKKPSDVIDAMQEIQFDATAKTFEESPEIVRGIKKAIELYETKESYGKNKITKEELDDIRSVGIPLKWKNRKGPRDEIILPGGEEIEVEFADDVPKDWKIENVLKKTLENFKNDFFEKYNSYNNNYDKLKFLSETLGGEDFTEKELAFILDESIKLNKAEVRTIKEADGDIGVRITEYGAGKAGRKNRQSTVVFDKEAGQVVITEGTPEEINKGRF